MSVTHAQKMKQRKRKARERHIRKMHNFAQNAAPKRYRLDVFHEGKWLLALKQWSRIENATKYRDDVERQRASGQKIIYGRIVDMQLGKVVFEIKATNPATEPVTSPVRDPEKPVMEEFPAVTEPAEAKTLTVDEPKKAKGLLARLGLRK